MNMTDLLYLVCCLYILFSIVLMVRLCYMLVDVSEKTNLVGLGNMMNEGDISIVITIIIHS